MGWISQDTQEKERDVAAMHERQRKEQREEEGESEEFRGIVEEEIEDDSADDVERTIAEC